MHIFAFVKARSDKQLLNFEHMAHASFRGLVCQVATM